MSNGTHYEVLARKYRPQTFAELTGQEHISRTLQNAIDSGRVAHAFLFSGARGVGKTSTARILAKALNCEQGVSIEPCNACPLCTEITRGTSTDVFEIDGASNTGVDDIRELRDNAKYLPSHSRYKIFIIDEVHMLSTNAFNALLKTLEEPPEHVKFIFATTEPHKLPITILSRCQRFDFKRVPLAKIVGRLRHIADAEGISVSDQALALIARKGDGSMRDSLTAFDQVLACCGSSVSNEDAATLIGAVDRRLLADMCAAIFAGDTQGVLAGIKRVEEVGYNLRQFCQELIEQVRCLMVVNSVPAPEEILDLSPPELEELRCQVDGFSSLDIQRRLTLLIRADGEMAQASFPRLVLEIALLRAATLEPVVPIQELLEQLKSPESTAPPAAAPPGETRRPPPAAPHPVPGPQAAPTPELRREPSPPLPATAPLPPGPEQQPRTATPSWERFVSFVNEKDPALGSLLEHGSPISQEPGLIRIGFPTGSYYLASVQDADATAELRVLASEFQGETTDIRIQPIAREEANTPPSLAEKKKSDREQRHRELRSEVNEHPLTQEALRVFGGAITEISNT